MGNLNEIWKDVQGYENRYQISNIGRVKSLERMVGHYTGGLMFLRSRILKHGKGRYPYIILINDGKRNTLKIHRMVAIAFIPNPNNKPSVNHINGLRDDNRVENLEWCTHKENMKHAADTGLKYLGENHPNSKLTKEDVIKIKKRISSGEPLRSIANNYSVNRANISAIKFGKSWKFVQI